MYKNAWKKNPKVSDKKTTIKKGVYQDHTLKLTPKDDYHYMTFEKWLLPKIVMHAQKFYAKWE